MIKAKLPKKHRIYHFEKETASVSDSFFEWEDHNREDN